MANDRLSEILKKWGVQQASGSNAVDQETAERQQKELEQMKVDSYNAIKGSLDSEDGYHCVLCNDKGMIAVLHYNEMYGRWSEIMVNCSCYKTRSSLRQLKRSGLSDAAKKYRFDNYITDGAREKSIYDAAKRFLSDEGGRWFFMGGQTGSGKTHICAAISVSLIGSGKKVYYMQWRDEITKIKAIVNESDEYERAMNALKSADVLYIDDLFKTGKAYDGRVAMPTAADVNAAFEIIDYRYNQPNSVTIISGERTINELMSIDEAIAGRIAERSDAYGYCINTGHDAKNNWRVNGRIRRNG